MPSEKEQSTSAKAERLKHPLPSLVKDLAHLKEICISQGDRAECFIALNGGAKSSKGITFMDPGWDIYHDISESWNDTASPPAISRFLFLPLATNSTTPHLRTGHCGWLSAGSHQRRGGTS